jgi:hypothetical protein
LATFAVPGLDTRVGWSHAPFAVSLFDDAMIAVGFLIAFLTFRENTFTAGTIEVAEDQTVIDSGPYAFVRHPMYAGALVMIAGIPPGARLMVGPAPGCPARSGPRVATVARGNLPCRKPSRLRRLSRPRTLPAGPDFLVVVNAPRCGPPACAGFDLS